MEMMLRLDGELIDAVGLIASRISGMIGVRQVELLRED